MSSQLNDLKHRAPMGDELDDSLLFNIVMYLFISVVSFCMWMLISNVIEGM